MPCKSSRDMHGPEGMLKAAVLGGGVDPPGALKLVDIPKPLQIGRVNEVFLGGLLFTVGRGDGEGDVLMNGVGDQREPFIGRVVDHGSAPNPEMLISTHGQRFFSMIMPHDRDSVTLRGDLTDGEYLELSLELKAQKLFDTGWHDREKELKVLSPSQSVSVRIPSHPLGIGGQRGRERDLGKTNPGSNAAGLAKMPKVGSQSIGEIDHRRGQTPCGQQPAFPDARHWVKMPPNKIRKLGLLTSDF